MFLFLCCETVESKLVKLETSDYLWVVSLVEPLGVDQALCKVKIFHYLAISGTRWLDYFS